MKAILQTIKSARAMHWFLAAIGTAIVGTIVSEFWVLIKGGTLFDFLEVVSGKVQENHFIRTDLVSTTKQSVAQWILAISCIIGWIVTFLSRQDGEGFIDACMFGIGYGFVIGLGILFLLANFQRFEDIHLAIGNAQYGIAGIVIISTVIMAIAFRLRGRA